MSLFSNVTNYLGNLHPFGQANSTYSSLINNLSTPNQSYTQPNPSPSGTSPSPYSNNATSPTTNQPYGPPVPPAGGPGAYGPPKPPAVNPINPPAVQRLSSPTQSSSTGGSSAATGGFLPTYYNGQQYTDPNSLAQAQMDYANKQNQSRPESFMQNFEGKVYSGIQGLHDYYQQLIQRSLQNHTQNQQNLDKAYQQGLINFDQRQHGLDLSRKQNLSSISGYFSSNSPYAYQSAQTDQEGQANDAYNQDVGNLNTDKGNFSDTYNQNTKGENQQYSDLQDQYANSERGATQNYNQTAQSAATNLQNYIDSVKNNLNQYNAQSAATAASTAASGGSASSGGSGGNAGTSVNPGDVAFNEYPYYTRDQGAFGSQYADQSLATHLQQQGIQPTQPLLDYLKQTWGTSQFLNTYNGQNQTAPANSGSGGSSF